LEIQAGLINGRRANSRHVKRTCNACVRTGVACNLLTAARARAKSEANQHAKQNA
jgi:hypothetical protein